MENFVNMTPHTLNIENTKGEMIGIEPSGEVARAHQSEEAICVLDGIAITRQTFGKVENLPAEKPNTYLIVSRLVAAAAPDRKDLLIPGPLLRGEDGKVVGAKGLSVL